MQNVYSSVTGMGEGRKMAKRKENGRRNFIKGLFAGVTILTFPGAARTYAANEKLNMACIGAGGQAGAGIGAALGQNLVAVAEVDQEKAGKKNLERVMKEAPGCKVFTDYRKLFDEVKGLDAVWVATPDHHHFPATIRALEAGYGCYTEKPMAYSIWETRKLRDVAAAKKVATQMGNQGHSSQTIRMLCEYIWSGTIGEVKEVHCVSNRNFSAGTKPATAEIPKGLDWDIWLGPAPQRDYHGGLHPFAWRGFLDFGTGSIGDMGCHTIDGSVWALKLTEAENVEVVAEEGACTEQGYPAKARIVYKFPARGEMPPVTIKWWNGGGEYVPPRPEALEAGAKQLTEGAYYFGSKMTMKSGSHCGDVQIIPDTLHRSTTKPAATLPRVPGHAEDFIRACKGGPAASCNFDYAARLTEIVLLGNVACRAGVGEKITYDFKKGTSNNEKANAYLKREPRKGWEFGYA